MSGSFCIAGREICNGTDVFIIAEAGVNHDGDLREAMRLIEAARDAGADAVKFQTWRTEQLVAPDAPLADYQRENAPGETDQFAMLKRLELSVDEVRALKVHADEVGITFLSTPDEEESADLLVELGLPALKIGSAEVTSLPFLRHVASKGLPVILSTGMATLAEVEAAVAVMRDAGGDDLCLLHCVSLYPAPPGDCNLRAMATLAERFGCPVGFSDHTLGSAVSVAAAALGAAVIEKHITLDRERPGPDHACSFDPGQFAEFCDMIREATTALGDGAKRPVAAEAATGRAVRKVILAARAIERGEMIPEDALVLRRAGAGISAAEFYRVAGRRAVRAIAAGEPVDWGALE